MAQALFLALDPLIRACIRPFLGPKMARSVIWGREMSYFYDIPGGSILEPQRSSNIDERLRE
jgi:hypothetical protein